MSFTPLPSVDDIGIPPTDPNSESPFSSKRRLRFGPLRISKGEIIANDGTSDAVKVDSEGLHIYNSSGTEIYSVGSSGFEGYGTTSQTIGFRETSGSANLFGKIGYNTGSFYVASDNSLDLYLEGDDDAFLVATDKVFLKGADTGNSNSSGVFFYDYDAAGYVEKTAIVPTSKGFNALYCAESPNVWFFDFCYGKKVIEFNKWRIRFSWKVKPDKMFLEVTEPPYFIIPTGSKNLIQIWGIRKGMKNKRFEKKTKKEFEENNKFWSTPKNNSKVKK